MTDKDLIALLRDMAAEPITGSSLHCVMVDAARRIERLVAELATLRAKIDTAHDNLEAIQSAQANHGIHPAEEMRQLRVERDRLAQRCEELADYETKYAAILKRCREDKTHGCWCGVHTSDVMAEEGTHE